jgi:hypothetical protein
MISHIIEKWLVKTGNPLKISKQLYEALVIRASQMEHNQDA